MDISIILAAGQGTRMKSKLPKVLHKVCGKPILEYVIGASKGAKIDKNIVIVGHGGDSIKEHFDSQPVVFKEQPVGANAPYGTGFAVMQAVDEIGDEDTVVILCGDTPLMTEDSIKTLLDYHKKNNLYGTVLTTLLDDASGYGRIKRDGNGNISKIVEDKDATDLEKEIKEINSGVYCFNGKILKMFLKRLDNNNAQNEYYITDIIGILKEEDYSLGACLIENQDEIHGVNSREQLSFSEKLMKERINKTHMSKGVTIIDPDNTYIEEDVNIGRDTIIYPGTHIEGNTRIGEDCILRGNTRILDSDIKNRVEIKSSVIENSTIEEDSTVGPNAHIRPGSHIGKCVKIGNFVEVKNSYIGDNSKSGHLAYIGDAKVGKNVNIGCGVIFVNYNGKEKLQTIVGDNAFIGSNSNLVAPVKVNDWGYIAAGSTITKEVEEGSLSVERASQTNIKGWVEKKGLKK
ncbi:MAG: bifunctional UDP-N-acetylglucosamine diphosphorylase/glucosamine-1-phosphate N-acetyltransferase GlmU [Tissierella sp.]|uniref:bifunctional UDP-N-acetylglucosamine diphosphorylase/glucosamine-1-phosphate N-acetyltransferase GlmU n=1 Tax=Tissierella sp. TaxID=41274 RepID=UPI003F99CBB7